MDKGLCEGHNFWYKFVLQLVTWRVVIGKGNKVVSLA